VADKLAGTPSKHRHRLVSAYGEAKAKNLVDYLDKLGILPTNDAQWRVLGAARKKLLPNNWNLQPPWDSVSANVLLAEGLFTVPEAAAFLRVGKSTLYIWMNRGSLPYVMFGTEATRKQRRIPRVALRLFAEKRLGADE